ncbi:MAG: hypothetical protein J5863_07260 [Desulfovibrio sp.]|nr:hypothetical protein [Desulfovibrio sp.]
MLNKDAMKPQPQRTGQARQARMSRTGRASASTPRQSSLRDGVRAAVRAGKLADEVQWLAAHVAACRAVIAAEENACDLFSEVKQEYMRLAARYPGDEGGEPF